MTDNSAMRISRFSSIRVRLVAIFLLIVLFPMSAIMAIRAISGSEGAQAQLATQLDIVASYREAAINSRQGTLKIELSNALAGGNAYQYIDVLSSKKHPESDYQDTRRILTARFRQLTGESKRFEALFLMDGNGLVVLSTEPGQEGRSYADESFFQKGLKETVVCPSSTARLLMMVSLPIIDGAGRTIGVFAGRAGLQALGDIMSVPAGLGVTGKSYLVGADHSLLSSLPGAEAGAKVSSKGIDAALTYRVKGAGAYKDFQGVLVYGVYRWLPELEAVLMVEQEQAESSKTAHVAMAANAGIAIAALLIAAIASLIVTRSISTPLADLAETANKIAAGQLDLTAEAVRIDEIGALAESFNFMTAKLRTTLEGLRKSEEKYRGIFENALEGIFQISFDGKILSANPAMARILGYDSQYEIIANITDIRTQLYCYPEDRDSIIAELLDRGEIIGRECQYYCKDRKKIWVSITASTVRDDAGNPLYIEGLLTDISDRKRAEEALAEARNYLDKIINFVADPIFVKDRQHRFVLINDACCELLGRSREELIGKDDLAIFNRDEAEVFLAKDEMVFQSGEENVNEESVTDSIEVVHTVVTKKTLYVDEKGEKFIVGVVRDVTERRRMEGELIKAQKLESVGLLAGGIAHDFNNLLTAILGNISLSKILISPQDKAYERLTAAEKASLRAKDLTQRLLTFSKGGIPVKKTISPAEVINDAAGLACSGSMAMCELSVPDDLWAIDADEGQISQVINNIVINAIQAMPNGGKVTVHCGNIVVSADDELPLRSGNYIKISIKDQGEGIPEESLGRIFDPYFTTREKGRGLGLATTYSIIKNHEGHVTVDSKVGAGTTFSIYLPASDSQAATRRLDEKKVTSGKGSILIMDDEEVIRQVAGDMLEYIGFDVDFAEDGSEAIEKYKAAFESGRPYDVVIMDLTIPGGMGGKEAIKKLIEIDPSVKAIVSSGYSNDPLMSEFRKYGFAGVVLKPYQIAELNEQVSKVLHET